MCPLSVDLRGVIVDRLKPHLPRRWKWYDHSVGVDELDRPTVILTLERIERLPEAPRAGRLITYTLTLIDPSTNVEQREDSLDDTASDLLNVIDDDDLLRWSVAERGLDKNQQHLGFDISITYPVTFTEESKK